jgi:uncharacterized protein YggE
MKRLMPATMAFLLLLAALPAGAAEPTELSVTGTGSVTLPPDVATVAATVETNADSVANAIGQNNARYDRVVAALTRMGIARDDIRLSNYNVNYNPKPQVVSPDNNGVRYGYTVSRDFSIKVRKISEAGKAVDACTSAGATGIDGVSFGLADPATARIRATEMAVADARAHAETLARAAQLRLVSLKSLSLGGGPIAPQPMMRMAAGAMAPSTQLDQSDVSVTVSVDAVYLANP